MPALLTPDSGLLFWMVVAFAIMFIVLAKFGFPVITKMVEDRKRYIDESLQNAREANEKLANIKSESEKIIREAREEQAKILKEAMSTSQTIIKEARDKANVEGQKMIDAAKSQITAEKEIAMRDIRSEVVEISTGIAEKVLRKNLENKDEQSEFINSILEEMKFDK
jgi:F-type H+-transporting ATPase subunit b